MAILIAFSTYLGTTISHTVQAKNLEIQKLNQIYVSMSSDSVDSMFGVPYIEIKEEGYCDSYYLLDNAVLRTVSKDNVVIAFFITAFQTKHVIPIRSFFDDNNLIELGRTTYGSVSSAFVNPETQSNYAAEPRITYYCQEQMTGRSGMYNTYVLGSLYYGFTDQKSTELMEISQEISQSEKDAILQQAKPNTYGVISDGYQESISMCPLYSQWLNICYVLTQNQQHR